MTRKKSAPDAALPKAGEVEALALPAAEEARAALAICERLVVTTPVEAEFAAGALREVAQRRDELDKQRKRWVEPLKSVAKEIDAAFRPAIKSLEAAEAAIKLALGRYALAAEEARSRALRRSLGPRARRRTRRGGERHRRRGDARPARPRGRPRTRRVGRRGRRRERDPARVHDA